MRRFVFIAVLVCLVTPVAQAADHPPDYVMVPLDPDAPPATAPPATAPPVTRSTDPASGLVPRVDSPSTVLLVPFYEVDTLSPTGTTTLFAIRNLTDNPTTLSIAYLSTTGALHSETVMVGPLETYTRNVRDVAGLGVEGDGFARGLIRVGPAPGTVQPANLTGDFLQVNVRDNFATGDRMIQAADVCNYIEVRFLTFGSGTEFRLLVNNPQGTDPATDFPSVSLQVYGEDGNYYAGFNFFTNSPTVYFNTDDLALPIAFGTIVFSFDHSNGGFVYAEYSAEGKFSVGMNGSCLD